MKNISFASHPDVPRLIEIASRYANAYGEPYDLSISEQHFHDIISDPNSIILTSLSSDPQWIITGFIAIKLLSNPLNNEKHAYKLHWIVDKSYPSRGTDLLRAAEHWASLHKATKFVVSVREERASLLMKRQKFTLLSYTYEKYLNGN